MKVHISRSVLLVLAVSLFVGLAFQGSRGLYESTEGRYALCACEMLDSGNWLEPPLFGEPHWSKPPLAYWTMAVGMGGLGRNAWCARRRLGTALCGSATCWFSSACTVPPFYRAGSSLR